MPNVAMMHVHARLIAYLRMDENNFSSYSTACLPGCSPRRNVLRHRYNRFFYVTDIHAAYNNVDPERLAEMLSHFGPIKHTKRQWLWFLELFCLTKHGGLVTGAPASPDLFNFYATKLLDEPIGTFAVRHNLTYSRYLDDLTFSSDVGPVGFRKRDQIREMVSNAGFSVVHHKSKVADLRKGPIEITGIGLERGGRLFLPKHYTRKIRGILHAAQKDPLQMRDLAIGMMGLLLGTTAVNTATEWELHELYEKFRLNYIFRKYE